MISSLGWQRGVALFGAGALSLGCRVAKVTPSSSDHSKLGRPISATVMHASGDSTEISARANFYFQVWQKPFERRYTALPRSGSVPSAKIPYSGWWWPEVNGGTNAGSPGALTKYDQVFNAGTTKASDWEAANHTRPNTDPDRGWAGHCNGWSAAAERHQEPFKDVTRNGVVFKPWDIKALLAEVYMTASDVFLGGTRCEDDSFTRTDPTKPGSCEDVDPGSFHLNIANWIGVAQHTLIFDRRADHEIWNQPLYAYQIVSDSDISKAQALQLLGQSGPDYVFNPNAVAFKEVQLNVSYANETQGEPQDYKVPHRELGSPTYQYILELNGSGEIIGGEWYGDSARNHPDFVWVAFEAQKGNGLKTFGNPEVDPAEVIKLWAESIGADPNKPPTDIAVPKWQNTWGRYANFDVLVDGANTGAAFLGKKIKLRIKRHDALVGAASVDIGFNDSGVITTLNGTASEDLTYDLDAVSGLNRLAFIWKKNGQPFDSPVYLRFNAVP